MCSKTLSPSERTRATTASPFDALALDGKTALVTGGSTGVGFEAARLLGARGARVLITGRDEDRLRAAAEAIPGAACLSNDAADPQAADALADHVRETLGALDILVLKRRRHAVRAVRAFDADMVDALLAANLRGPWLQLRALDRLLNDGPSIQPIGSISISSSKSGPANARYAASKAALSLWMRAIAAQCGPRGIRLNIVSPGPVDTPASSKTGLPEETVAQIRKARAASMPSGRCGRREEIAEVVAFLASAAASFVNGADVLVDGGMLAA